MLYRGEPEHYSHRTPSGLRPENIELMEREFYIDNAMGNKLKNLLRCHKLTNPNIMYYLFLTIVYGYRKMLGNKITPVYEYYDKFFDSGGNNIRNLIKKFIGFCDSTEWPGTIATSTGEVFFKIDYILKDYAFFQHSGYPTLLLDITDDYNVAKNFAGSNGIIYKFNDKQYKDDHSWITTINLTTKVTNIHKTSGLWSWKNELYSDALYTNQNILEQKGYVIYVPYNGAVDKYFEVFQEDVVTR